MEAKFFTLELLEPRLLLSAQPVALGSGSPETPPQVISDPMQVESAAPQMADRPVELAMEEIFGIEGETLHAASLGPVDLKNSPSVQTVDNFNQQKGEETDIQIAGSGGAGTADGN